MAMYMCPVNAHDVGGADLAAVPLDLSERSYELWEREVHALLVCLVSAGHMTVDEMRRGIEHLPADTYNSWGYYEKWAASIAVILVERGIFNQAEWVRVCVCVDLCPCLQLNHTNPLPPPPPGKEARTERRRGIECRG